jgi:hypothetical protein
MTEMPITSKRLICVARFVLLAASTAVLIILGLDFQAFMLTCDCLHTLCDHAGTANVCTALCADNVVLQRS